MVEITLKNGYRELPEEEINDIINKNEEQNERLREFFYKKAAAKKGGKK